MYGHAVPLRVRGCLHLFGIASEIPSSVVPGGSKPCLPTTFPAIDDCAAACDKVIINGRLVKNITFKTLKERDCHHDLKRVCGDVRHCTVEIPFHLFVDVKGAQEGDDCEVIDAIVAGEFDKLIDKNSDGTFNKLLERGVL